MPTSSNGAWTRTPVTGADLLAAVDDVCRAYAEVPEAAWHDAAGDLTWTRWQTVEHVADDLFAYATQLTGAARAGSYVRIHYDSSDGGPGCAIRVDHSSGVPALLESLRACAVLLVATAAWAPDEMRGWHPSGDADGEGFVAMGLVEVLLHTHDVLAGLDIGWRPDDALCDRVLARLWARTAPPDPDRWAVLRWLSGRGDLPGRDRVVGDWLWDGRPVEEQQ